MSEQQDTSSHRDWRPIGLMIAVAISIGALMLTAGPLRDVDVFWHVRVGGELLQGVSIYEVGRDWSFAPVPDHWVSTQWIVEILFSWLNTLWGWNGLIGYRVLTTALAIAVLGWSVFRGRHREANRVWASLTVFLFGAFTLMLFSQERPQQISFVLMPVVGYWWLRAMRDGEVPRWWGLLILTAIWANCHGLWIMLPVALFLALMGRLWDYGRGDRAIKPLIVATIASLVGGCITPIGPLNLLTPLRFAATTSKIQEWQPTKFIEPTSYCLVAVALLLIIAWAFGKSRPSRGEVLFGLLIMLFSASAERNIMPAILLLAPLAAWRLSVAFRGPKRREAPEGLVTIAKPATYVFAALAVLVIVFVTVTSIPIPAGKKPLSLVQSIALMPHDQNVLNGYDISGLVLWYARPEVSQNFVRVGIDGRADRYGAAYIDQYLDMIDGKEGWQKTLDELAPSVALLPVDEPLPDLLKDRGWLEVGTEADYVLLVPPGHHH